MSRIVTVGAAQLGPIARAEGRAEVVERLIALLRQAKAMGCDLVVFPELALTTFFPRWFMTDEAQIDAYFEREMPGPQTRPLFAEAQRLGLGFCLGYAELVEDASGKHRFNTAILVDAEGRIVGMCICNDRRWPETYRVMGLQGVELVLVGYNTPLHNPPAPEHDHLSAFHNHLVMQAGAYQNGTFVVGVAKGGTEEGVPSLAGSAIIAPSGEIVAQAASLGDELIVARCDLDLTRSYKETIFNFAQHRVPEAYRLITERKGAQPPE